MGGMIFCFMEKIEFLCTFAEERCRGWRTRFRWRGSWVDSLKCGGPIDCRMVLIRRSQWEAVRPKKFGNENMCNLRGMPTATGGGLSQKCGCSELEG